MLPGSGFDTNNRPTWEVYPDVRVKDEAGEFRGYRLDGGFMESLHEALDYLTGFVGMTRDEATAYLGSLDNDVWDDFFE